MKYRPDIDGLRAIAILLVIIYHIWPHCLGGGFIGVDVFFVISGYLITSIINPELLKNNFRFNEFYKRRIKRILPVYFTMVFLSSIIAFLLFVPSNYNTFLKSAVSSSFFVSNWYFYQLSSYFSLGTNEYPLLHTWSLAVEEQYYIFWPLILFFFRNIRHNNLKILTFCICLCSLLFSIYCAKYNSDLGYYSIFSRAFELMVGSFLAIHLEEIKSPPHNDKFNTTLANIYSMIGIIVIILSSFMISNKLPFPSYYGLFPTIATAMIIYAGFLTKQSLINKFLSSRPLVFVGLVSYSAYIWHWPILAFWHYYNPDKILDAITGLDILLLITIFTLLSYYLIERPMKRNQYGFKKSFFIFYLIPTTIITLSISLAFFKPRIHEKLRQEMSFADNKYCFGRITGNCVVGDLNASENKVILFGDSHAGMLAPFWNQIAQEYKFKFKSLSSGSCYPLIDPYYNLPKDIFTRDQGGCIDQIKYITKNFNEYKVFIITASWYKYFQKTDNNNFVFESQLESTINYLVNHDKKVVLIGDIPLFNNAIISTTLRQEMMPIFANNNNNKLINKNENKSFYISNKKLKYIANKFTNDVYFLDLNEIIELNKSFPFINDFLIYKDDDHLNQAGAIILADEYLRSPNSLILKKYFADWGIIKESGTALGQPH